MTAENESPIIIYEEAGKAVEVRLDTQSDTVWLTQRQMADVFETSTDNISLHLKNIYRDAELDEGATTEESSVVRQEGKRQVNRRIRLHNLDAIISVGYRVNSRQAVHFRFRMAINAAQRICLWISCTATIAYLMPPVKRLSMM